MIKGTDIVLAAREWIGTPFHHQGRAKGIGVDCAGLVICVARELGLTKFDITDYPAQPDPSRMRFYLDQNLVRLNKNCVEPGAVLWLAFDDEPRHLAIASDIGIIHATAKYRKVIEHGLDAVWMRRLRSVYWIPGVDRCN